MITREIKKLCKTPELIENYDLAVASKEPYVCHHRKESKFTASQLKAMGLYYSRPPEELIFLTKKEHKKPGNHQKTKYKKPKMVDHSIVKATKGDETHYFLTAVDAAKWIGCSRVMVHRVLNPDDKGAISAKGWTISREIVDIFKPYIFTF